MQHKIQVLKIENVSGTGKNGPYNFNKLHCVIEIEGEDPIIGVLVPPKGIDVNQKGHYVAEFGLGVDREQRVVGVLKTLTLVPKATTSVPSTPKAS